jgi:hypothetical protein
MKQTTGTAVLYVEVIGLLNTLFCNLKRLSNRLKTLELKKISGKLENMRKSLMPHVKY